MDQKDAYNRLHNTRLNITLQIMSEVLEIFSHRVSMEVWNYFTKTVHIRMVSTLHGQLKHMQALNQFMKSYNVVLILTALAGL